MKKLEFALNEHDTDEYIALFSRKKNNRIELCASTLDEYFKLPKHKIETRWGIEDATPEKIILCFSERKLKDSYFAIVPEDNTDLLIEDTWEEYILGPARQWMIKNFPKGCYVKCEYE